MPESPAPMPRLEITIDGNTAVVELTQGDYVRAEVDGHTFAEDEPISPSGVASLAYHAVKRCARKGLIDFAAPETWDDFLDSFAFTFAGDEETEGNA